MATVECRRLELPGGTKICAPNALFHECVLDMCTKRWIFTSHPIPIASHLSHSSLSSPSIAIRPHSLRSLPFIAIHRHPSPSIAIHRHPSRSSSLTLSLLIGWFRTGLQHWRNGCPLEGGLRHQQEPELPRKCHHGSGRQQQCNVQQQNGACAVGI